MSTHQTRRDDGSMPQAEMLERDTLGALVPVDRTTLGGGRALGAALPVAFVAAVLVGSLAFGAAGLHLAGVRTADEGAGGTPATGQSGPAGADGTGGGGEALGRPGQGSGTLTGGAPGVAPAQDMDGEPTDDPTDDSTAEPTAAPTLPPVVEIELKAAWSDGRVRLSWTGCEPEGFAYWKVVRSRDATVAWPRGEDDTLVAAFDDPASRAAKDGDAPRGRTAHYRVFALARVGDAKVVACASNVDAVAVPEPTARPEPTAKPGPTDDPGPSKLGLEIGLKYDHPYLAWTECKEPGFDYYKVVASPDDTVRWPLGDNDHLRAAIGDRGQTAFKDADAPAGKKLWYRVFCVNATDEGYLVLAATAAKAISVPDGGGEPAPDPTSIGFAAAAAEGVVILEWEACRVDGFVYYKVVRSHGSNPSYLPWTDGTELIGVISEPGATRFEDADVASGLTWFYRVQAIGYWGGQKAVLCQTQAAEVPVP